MNHLRKACDVGEGEGEFFDCARWDWLNPSWVYRGMLGEPSAMFFLFLRRSVGAGKDSAGSSVYAESCCSDYFSIKKVRLIDIPSGSGCFLGKLTNLVQKARIFPDSFY